jgi:diacylglycerol kinase
MWPEKFSILKRLESFKYAFNGLRILLLEEHNAKLHLLATIVVCGVGVFFRISHIEWCVIVISIGMVFAFELINTAMEHLSDYVQPGMDSAIKKIKDLSAAAVLISALVAFVCAIVIFLPKINLL